MRVTTIFLLFAVAVLCVRGNGDDDDDDDDDQDKNSSESESNSSSRQGEDEEEKGIEPDCEQYKQPTCPKKGDPICGTDNKKYSNECELCLENRRKKTNVEILKFDEC